VGPVLRPLLRGLCRCLHGNNIEAVWHADAPVEDAARRVLATVLSTDIVASTEHVARLGDRQWSAVLQRHYTIVRRHLERCGGREIDTAGDGFLAAFDQPGSAIRCAVALVEENRATGIEMRAGLHTGECEQLGTKLTGIAVHIAARVASQAGANEVLVSQTVNDLVAGSELALTDLGVRELKGIPGTWRLYSANAGSSHS
jgi:class 3 adenylate cyclase